MQPTETIDRRDNLHIYQARPWHSIGSGCCGATPKKSDCVVDDKAFDSLGLRYRRVTFNGREYQGEHAVVTYRGQVRKVCGLCMSGGEPEEPEEK